MDLWDDVKGLAGDARDAVVDVFDGSDDEQQSLPIASFRPEYQGGAFRTVNPAYQVREDEFEKPLWVSGADNQSPYSSWDTGFLERTFKQQEKLVDEGKLGEWFDRENATGVVTWDHVTKSGKELKFGDILDKGKLLGNLYEEKDGTPADADLMMAQFLLEPEELAQIGADRDSTTRLRGVLEEVRQKNNVEIPQALAAAEQQGQVDASQKGIQDAAGGRGDDIVATALGAAGGAALGGGLALSATGIGLVPGLAITGIGAGVSGLAAWLNRDDISEQVASAYEISKQAYQDDQGNLVGDTASSAKQWAGVLGRGLAPLSNLARGAVDSDRGNGVGALQEEDRPSWAKPLDIAATIADMGLTFGSPLGVAAYSGQIGVSTAGALTELTLGGGQRWDAQAGEFRNVYEDEQGEISLTNGLSAWGSTGIDLAQLAMVRGVASKISGADQRAIGRTMNGGKVASVESQAGRTFYLDADKKVLASKVNVTQVFVPSEGVQFIAAGGLARGAAAGRGAKAGADDLYKASVAITRAGAPIKAALVNAVGEGTEEAVQEALDTWTFDHEVELQQLAEAYAYGAASGLGMGFAMNYRTRSEEGKELNLLTRQGYELQHGPVDGGTWNALYKSGLTSEEKQGYRAANFTPEQRAALKKALGSSVAEQGGSTANGLIVSNAAAKVVEMEQDRLTSKAGVAGRTISRAGANTFQSLATRGASGQVLISNGAVADDSGATGFTGLLTQYQEKLTRLPEILASIDSQVAEATAVMEQQTQAGADTVLIQKVIADLQDTRSLWEGSKPTLEEIIQRLSAIAPVMMRESGTDPVEKRAQVDMINQYLDGLYRSKSDSVALAAAKFRLRSPYDNVGSFYVTGPALDWTMVRDGFDGTETMDWAALDTTTADFDGDRITGTTSLILGRRGFTAARTGQTWLNSMPDKNGKTVTSYKVASIGQDEAISTNLYLVHKGQRTPAAQKAPSRGLRKFVELVAARYSMPTSEAKQMEDALTALLLDVQTDKPIETLMTYAAQVQNPVAKRMIDYAWENRTNEASVVTGIYRAAMDQAVAEVNHARWAALPAKQRTKTDPPKPNAYGVGQTKRSQEAVTLYSTFMQYYGTQDSLRIGQVLRQSGEDYTDTGVKGADTNALLVAAGAELRELAKGKIEAAYKGGLDPFDVTARVHEMALDITNGNHTLAYELLVAPFGKANFEGKEVIRAQHDVTVAQALTDAIVSQLRRQGAVAISRDQDLSRKLDMLETASRDTQSPSEKTRSDGETLILRDALGMFNVADVAGIGSTAGWETSGLLATGTITQNVRILQQHDRPNRAKLRKSMDAAAENSASPGTYREMVALIHELANSEYSIDDTGRVYGRLADRNSSSSKAALEIRQNVRQAVQQLGLDLTHEGVLEALSTQNGQMIFDAFVKQTGIASFVKRPDGSFTPRSWVLDYFTTERDGEAEVLLWRNRALTALHLASTRETLSASIKDREIKDEYRRVDDSLAKLMIYLREQNPVLLSELEIQLDQATSRESLEQWINSNSISFDMPVLMYENSVAQFDPTLRNGGWGSAASNYGADLREVVETSRTFLSRTKELVERRAINIAAASTLRGQLDDPNNGLVRAARESLIEAANVSQVRTMDPNDTAEAAALIHQFGQEMYTKGADLEAIRAYSTQQVAALVQTSHTDPFVDSVNVALGVIDIKILRSRPELIFTASAFTDEFGRKVAVPPLRDASGNPDLGLVLDAIINDKQTGVADLLAEAWLPLAHKYNRAADISTVVHRGPQNLRDLFEKRFDKAFTRSASGSYTTEANMAFLVETSAAAQTADQTQVAVADRAAIAVATPRIFSGKEAMEATDIAKVTNDASQALAAVLRMAGQYINSDEGSAELYREQVLLAARELVEGQVDGQRMRQERMNKFRVHTQGLAEEQQGEIMAGIRMVALAASIDADLDVLQDRIAAGRFTPEQRDAMLEELLNSQTSAPLVRMFQSAANGDPYGDLEYLYGTAEVQNAAQRRNIAAHISANPDLAGRLLHDKKATQAMAYFSDPTMDYSAQQWDVLRNIVISDIIQSETNPVSSQSDFLIVFTDPIRQDPTFSALFKELLLPENALVSASVGITKDHVVPVDLAALRRAMEALFPTDGSIRWDQSIGAGTEMLDATYPSISAGQAATVHGNTGKTANAMSMASRTNTVDVPPAEYLQTVKVVRTWDGIQVFSADGLPTGGAEFLDGAIGIPGDKVLDPLAVQGVVAPYQAMTHARLERALLIGEEMQVQLFHPMFRPAGAKWHNSVYFDGVPAHNSPLSPDFPSLIAGLYMQANGITQRGTRFTLDAVKDKTPALYRTAVTPQGNLDLNRVSDPTEYLSTLATILSGTELGYGALGDVSFRPILKYITMRHVVTYDDGGVSSVYEYMAQRAANPEATAAREPQLVAMSERTANTFYGEIGTSGLQGFVPSGRLSYGQQMFNWDALTDLQKMVLQNLRQSVPIGSTSAAARSALGAVTRGSQAEYRTALRDFGALYRLMGEAARMQNDRVARFADLNLKVSQMQSNQKTMSNSRLADDAQAAGMQLAPDGMESLLAAMSQQDTDFSGSASYRLVLARTGDHMDGGLTLANFNAFTEGLGDATFGDSIALALDDFTDQEIDQVLSIVKYMINRKVTITVRGGKSSETRSAVQRLLNETTDYAPLENQSGTYAPIEAVAVYQMERAYISRAMEQRNTSAESRLLTFIPDEGQSGFGSIGESSAAIINNGKRQIVRNVLLKQFSSEFLTPIHRADTAVVRDLITNREFIDALRADVPDEETSGMTHEAAVADLLQRAADGELSLATKNLQIRKGMFEVYVVNASRAGDPVKVYLHRLGSKFIDNSEIVKLRRSGDKSFVTGPTETEAQQTLVEGRVSDARIRNDGLLLDIQSDQFWRNNKLIPHTGGNKVMTQALAEDLAWLRDRIAGDLSFDLVTNATDSMKKLSMMDAVRDFASAAELLGFDNMAVFYQGAYGKVYDANSTDAKRQMSGLRTMLNTLAQRNDGSFADHQDMIEFIAKGAMADSRIVALTTLAESDPELTQRLGTIDLGVPHARVLLAAMSYLTLPGAELSGIESAGGYTSAEARKPGLGSRRMPDMFTRIYDLADDTRELALGVFNSRLEPNVELLNDYSVRITHGEGFTDGRIAFSNYSVVGESQGDNYDPTANQGVSTHDLRVLEQAAGAFFANNFDAGAFTQFVDDATVSDTVAPLRTAAPAGQRQPWWNIGVAQRFYRAQAAKKLSYFFHAIDLTNDGVESEVDVTQVQTLIRDFAKLMFRDSTGASDIHVHTMIRLMLGRPAASKADETEAAKIGLSKVRLALDAMNGNLAAGYSPLRRGAVSLMPIEIRNAYIAANAGKEGGRKLRVWTGKKLSNEFADTADTITRAFFDHSLADPEANNIDSFNTVMDAVYHQYQQTSTDTMSLPVSLDLVKDLRLMSYDFQAEKALEAAIKDGTTMAQFAKELPGALATSLFRGTEIQLTPAVLHEMTNSATLAQKIGMNDVDKIDTTPPSLDVLNYVEARLAKHDRAKDIPFPTKRSTQQTRDSGGAFTDNESNSHKIFRNLLALHAGKALLNPPLMLGAMIDSRMRAVVADARRMATGESIGPVGRRLASVVESQGKIGSLARGLGWRVMFTPKQIGDLKRILNTTALTGPMNEAIFKELSSYAASLNEQGVIKPIVKLNKIATAMQDIGHGTKGKVMRSHYLQAALADYVFRQNGDLSAALAGLSYDGGWLAKLPGGASHNAGVQAMNDLRGTQETVISSAISSAISPLTHSGNGGVNAVAQMTLAMPLMFQRYASNLFLTLTGARALDQLAAHALHGRAKPGFWNKVSASARSESTDLNPNIDMSEVIGGLDAMDAVINMGITHSLLFTGGLVAGGLGLGGEDEEEKRRRRAAAAQGAVWLSDPREVENDFRNAHALFLDEIPGLSTLFANDSGRAIVSPHWILKPLVSPLLGMERFFGTGDIRQLKWGFEDAITSMPLLNMVTFNKAVTMSEELSHAAQDAAAEGNLGASDSSGFLTHLVAYYESALFESSFLNALYVGFDDYDRDPYVMPLRDSDGDLQRDAEGNVRANSDQRLRSDGLEGRGLALQSYVDDDGKVQQGYWTESDASTKSRILAESRLSYGLVSSLFTGLAGEGLNTRYNMAVKTRKVDKPELKQNEEMAVILGAYVNEANAALLSGGKQSAEEAVTLSFLSNYGEEVLSHEGAMSIFRGLAGGSVTVADASLQGVYIDYDTRINIQTKWLDELTVEGMRLGLSESSAKSRAYKVWNGTGDLPGIADILWSSDISYSKTQEFQQLNTTYLKGPDGNIWATGFERTKLLGAMGLAPLTGQYTSGDTRTDLDGRLNVSAFGTNNTGQRGLRPVNDSLDIPTDAEIGDAITRAVEDLDGRDYSSGYGGFGGGGGGGGGYPQRPVFNSFYPPRWTNQNFNPITLRVPYANDVYSIRTDDVRTDSSTIRRERISSDRGRLTQWQ